MDFAAVQQNRSKNMKEYERKLNENETKMITNMHEHESHMKNMNLRHEENIVNEHERGNFQKMNAFAFHSKMNENERT